MVETFKSKSIGRSVCVPGCPFACVPMYPKKYLSSDLFIHKKISRPTKKTRNGAEFQLVTLVTPKINAVPKNSQQELLIFPGQIPRAPRTRVSRVGWRGFGKGNKWINKRVTTMGIHNLPFLGL